MNRTALHQNSFLPFVLLAASVALTYCTHKTPEVKKPVKSDSLSINESVTGKASFYANMLEWCTTSSGDDYDVNDFTCAHRTLPFNTILRITNTANGKTAIVRVNDRGPYRKGRIIDLSRAAAKKLGMLPDGVTKIKMVELSFPDFFPLTDSILNNGDVVDTHGNRKQPGTHGIHVWSTQNLRHAVYMATSIQDEYHVDDIYIKVSGDNTDKHYILYIPEVYNKKDADKLIVALKQDGFSLCRSEKK